MGLSEIASLSQIQRLWVGKRFDFSIVCQIAYFIGMCVEDLTQPELSSEQIEMERKTHYMINKKPIKWEELDDSISIKLEEMAQKVFNGSLNSAGRPEKVSEKMAYREFGLDKYRLENMPKCRAILEKYSESYEEYWARKVEWAVKKIQEEGQTLTLTWILKYTNMRKKNFEACVPYLGEELRKEIQDLM